MLQLPFRILLFLASYAPLFGLLAWRSREDAPTWIVLSALAILSVVGLLIVVFTARDMEGARLDVKSIVPKDAETLAYVATYLIPFLALDLTKCEDRVSFLVFMTVLAVIAVTSNTLFVNPVLSLVGYRTYEVTDKDSRVYFLVTRSKVISNSTITPLAVGDFVRFEPWRRHS